jgi:hypothetical protein
VSADTAGRAPRAVVGYADSWFAAGCGLDLLMTRDFGRVERSTDQRIRRYADSGTELVFVIINCMQYSEAIVLSPCSRVGCSSNRVIIDAPWRRLSTLLVLLGCIMDFRALVESAKEGCPCVLLGGTCSLRPMLHLQTQASGARCLEPFGWSFVASCGVCMCARPYSNTSWWLRRRVETNAMLQFCAVRAARPLRYASEIGQKRI